MTKYKNQWAAEKYDRISLMVPQGRKAEIQTYVASLSPPMSVNAYINKLIDQDMQKDED